MLDRTANLLGAVGLLAASRVEEIGRDILNRSGETPAALVVIGHGTGPSNEQLRSVLGLSHPGAVRLVDRLVADGLVERQPGKDKRAVALHLTQKGKNIRERFMKARLGALKPLLATLSQEEQAMLSDLLGKILQSVANDDLEKRARCRLCDKTACGDCPIAAGERTAE